MGLMAIAFTSILAMAGGNLREVSGTSCRAIRVNLALGLTTQLIFEQEPKVTLFADKLHYKIVTNAASPRSVAIIPVIDPNELQVFRDNKGRLFPPVTLAEALDKSFRTNLFVMFDHGNQMMFDLRFVEKTKADYLVKVKQLFKEDCEL